MYDLINSKLGYNQPSWLIDAFYNTYQSFDDSLDVTVENIRNEFKKYSNYQPPSWMIEEMFEIIELE